MQQDLSSNAYREFSVFIKKRLGIVLGDNKEYLVKSRLTKLMRTFKYENLDLFVADIVKGISKDAQRQALCAMTTNETFWFRDHYPYTTLSEVIFPELIKQQRKLRIWSSACSSGQEPYSIAMCLREFENKVGKKFYGAEIIATDVSETILSFARSGKYDKLAVARGLSQQRLNQFFRSSGDMWEVTSELKSLIQFRHYNLLDNYATLGTFDIIFCRNVLIYFDEQTKSSILQKFSAQLPQKGVLFLGAAESAGVGNNMFKMHRQSQGLYYSKN